MISLIVRRSSSRLLGSLIASAVLALPGLAYAADQSGVTASGNVSGDFRIGCTTCSHYPLDMSGDSSPYDGGPGFVQAQVAYAGGPLRSSVPLDYTLGGGAALAAAASLEGPLATPVLKARALADNFGAVIPLSNPNLEVGIDLYNVSSQAQGVQRYTYVGSGSATYTFEFHVDGTVTNQQALVFASAGFFDDFLEVSYAFNSVSVEGNGFNGTSLPFDRTFTLSMTFQAGESFHLKASLSADALSYLDYASADYSAMPTTRCGWSVSPGAIPLCWCPHSPPPYPSRQARCFSCWALAVWRRPVASVELPVKTDGLPRSQRAVDAAHDDGIHAEGDGAVQPRV